MINKVIYLLLICCIYASILNASNKIIKQEYTINIKSSRNTKMFIFAAVAIVVTAAFNIYTNNLIRKVTCILIGNLLILMAVIDYYTKYVYIKISLVGIIFSTIAGTFIYGVNNVLVITLLSFLLVVIAYFSGKWYGDIQALYIIGCANGSLEMIVINLIAAITATIITIRKKSFKEEIAYCPCLAVGYITVLIIKIFI